MGCLHSTEETNPVVVVQPGCSKCAIVMETAATYNEFEIDRSHFILSKKILGIGGFGLVNLVQKISGDDMGTFYAMKSLSKASIVARPSGYSSVFNELRALSLLPKNPFICNMSYAFQDESFLYLVVDLVEGGDMRNLIRKSENYHFTEARAKFYIYQIILSVAACHDRNILHRDVKPENILICRNGYLKLTDFGVSKILPNIEECRSSSGTHGYMAPEIYSGNHLHGTTADWFAVGVTLHEFVCGRRPFETGKLQAFRRRDAVDELDLRFLYSCAYLSEGCKNCIAALLHPRPHQRLGYDCGIDEIQCHEWFQDLPRSSVERQELAAFYLPPIGVSSGVDLHDETTRMAIRHHYRTESLTAEQQQRFSTYGYRNILQPLRFEQQMCCGENSEPGLQLVSNKATIVCSRFDLFSPVIGRNFRNFPVHEGSQGTESRNEVDVSISTAVVTLSCAIESSEEGVSRWAALESPSGNNILKPVSREFRQPPTSSCNKNSNSRRGGRSSSIGIFSPSLESHFSQSHRKDHWTRSFKRQSQSLETKEQEESDSWLGQSHPLPQSTPTTQSHLSRISSMKPRQRRTTRLKRNTKPSIEQNEQNVFPGMTINHSGALQWNPEAHFVTVPERSCPASSLSGEVEAANLFRHIQSSVSYGSN